MAVTDQSLYHASEGMILPTPRRYFRASMHARHWQLRAFVSCPEDNVVYYPGNSDIFRLNTASRVREVITTLPFIPRCMTAAKGYICCGAEDGDFACIRIPVSTEASRAQERTRQGLRAMLNFDYGNMSRLDDSSDGMRGVENIPMARTLKIGSEIVNCITLWFPNDRYPTYNVPVAIVSNNDKSVYIVDLDSFEEIERLEFQDCVNRATMSPDGQLLVAVGDDRFLHVFHRRHKGKSDRSVNEQQSYGEWTWVKEPRKIQLEGQYLGDINDMRGSFTAEFSASGRYLAVGTQYGVVSIFDTSSLTDRDVNPLITCFRTTRHGTTDGAIRAMEFSPDPFDLLAWTEDSGRVIIADVRQHFMSRQLITVEPDAEGIEVAAFNDRSGDTDIDPRLRSFHHDNQSSGERGNEMYARSQPQNPDIGFRPRPPPDQNSEIGFRPRPPPDQNSEIGFRPRPPPDQNSEIGFRPRPPSDQNSEIGFRPRPPPDRAPPPPDQNSEIGFRPRPATNPIDTESENLQSHRRRRERVILLEGLARVSDLHQFSERRAAESRTAGPPSVSASSLREFINSRSNESLRAFISERNAERDRRGYHPRTRGAVILAAAQEALDREETAESPRERDAQETRTPRTAWSELEALYNLSTGNPQLPDSQAQMRIEFESQSRRHASNRESLRRQLDSWQAYDSGYVAGLNPEPRPSHPNQTTGCSWSPDGRTLYVGTEVGIYELKTNVIGRRMFSSINVR